MRSTSRHVADVVLTAHGAVVNQNAEELAAADRDVTA